MMTIDGDLQITEMDECHYHEMMVHVPLASRPPGAGACVEIKILRCVRAESSRRSPRHRRAACSTAWRCRFLTARPIQDGRIIAEK